MKDTWKVKYSGKLDLYIFSFTSVLLGYICFIIKKGYISEGDLIEALLSTLVFLFPIVIGIIWVVSSMLRKKLVPKVINVDSDSKCINITYFKTTEPQQIDLNELSFNKIEYGHITILVLYKKGVATLGHTLHFELFSMVALPITISWKKKQVYEIVNKLKYLNVEEHIPLKQKSIIDYILE